MGTLIKKIANRIYLFITILATIGGAIAFVQMFISGNDYELTLHLLSTEKLIENNNRSLGLSVLFKGKEVKSLFLTRFELENSGKKALTKDFIYEPLELKIQPTNTILKLDSNDHLVALKNGSIVVTWTLLNPHTAISFSVFTTDPIVLSTSQQLREITDIRFIDEIKNPTKVKRLESISIIWFLLIPLAIFFIIDVILLLKEDPKLQKVLDLINSLTEAGSVNKVDFLNRLSLLYTDYYGAVRGLLVSPDELIRGLSSEVGSVDTIPVRHLEHIQQTARNWVLHRNLYFSRGSGIVIGPLLLGFCLIRIAIAVFF